MKRKKEQKSTHLSYPLLDNALDFLLHAAEHVGQDSPRSWKYAILHLISGIELLLKARLEIEHWSLVFQETDRANVDTYESGDFRSVDFDSLIRRLGGISSVSIPETDRDHLNGLKRLRNRLEHFGIDIDLTQVKSLMAKGLSYALAFYEDHIKQETGDFDRNILEKIVGHLHEFEEFVAERLESIKPNIPEGAMVRDCPECSQDTMEIKDEAKLYCHFCRYEVDAEILAEQHSEVEVEVCPECGYRAVAFIIYNNESAGWECYACGNEFDTLQKCDYCGEIYSGDGPVCRDCISAMIERDRD